MSRTARVTHDAAPRTAAVVSSCSAAWQGQGRARCLSLPRDLLPSHPPPPVPAFSLDPLETGGLMCVLVPLHHREPEPSLLHKGPLIPPGVLQVLDLCQMRVWALSCFHTRMGNPESAR